MEESCVPGRAIIISAVLALSEARPILAVVVLASILMLAVVAFVAVYVINPEYSNIDWASFRIEIRNPRRHSSNSEVISAK
jgi:hypothetical protein